MRVLAAVVLVQVIASPGWAQQSQPLSLEAAWEIATENSPRYNRSQNALASAEVTTRGSRAAFLPSLSLGFSSNGSLSRTFTGQDEFGQPVRRDDPLEFTNSSSGQSISIGLPPLFDGGSRYRQWRAAQASEQAVQAGSADEMATLRADISRRYYDAKHLTDLIAVQEALLKGAESRREATERLLRVAIGSPIDLLGAEIDVARQESALEQARGNARKATLLLGEAMGVSGSATWELTTDPPAVFDPSTLKADSIVETALATSPRVAQTDAQFRAAEQQRRVAGASRWPTLSGSIGASRGIGGRGTDALFDINPPNQNFGVGLNLSIPIFNSQSGATRARAMIAVLDAAENQRAARLALEREIRSALIDLDNAYRVVQLADRSRDLERRRLDLANDRYRLGSLRFTELQTIIDGAATAERAALDARYDFATAVVALEQLTRPYASSTGAR